MPRSNPTGILGLTGPLIGFKTKTLRRTRDMPATLNISGGHHGKRGKLDLQPAIEAAWEDRLKLKTGGKQRKNS